VLKEVTDIVVDGARFDIVENKDMGLLNGGSALSLY
jgi:hypothetical protein